MRRGEIWITNLNSPRGREVGKLRHVLIVQPDELTLAGTPLIIVLPLMTQARPDFRHWRVGVAARDRVRQDCQAIVGQPRALDGGRFGDEPLTELSREEMERVEHCLRVALGMF